MLILKDVFVSFISILISQHMHTYKPHGAKISKNLSLYPHILYLLCVLGYFIFNVVVSKTTSADIISTKTPSAVR